VTSQPGRSGSISRRLAIAIVATLAVLGGLTPAAAAAEPPDGVVLDAAVTVTVTRPSPTGGTEPLADATVTLLAYVTDFPEDPFQELGAVTDASGVAAFEGVARGDPGGPVVHLAAAVYTERVTFDGECVTTESWQGMAIDVPSADGVDIPILVNAASSIVCPPPDGEELPDGLVADAGIEVGLSLAGAPVDGLVSAFISWDGWSTIVEAPAIDGVATFEGLPRPTDPALPVQVVVSAVAQIPGIVAGCTYLGAAEGGASLELTDEGMVQVAIAVDPQPFEAPDASQALTVTDRAGKPIAGSTVFVLQSHADEAVEPWSCTATTDATGQVTMPLYDWGTASAPSEVSFEAHGPIAYTETRNECVLSFGPYGQLLLAQDGGQAVAAVLETDIVELDAVCSTTGTPAPGSGVGGGPAPTLPPTDAVRTAGGTGWSLLPVLVVLALVAAAAVLSVSTPRSRRRL
jgi:hypothetical protein